jgi:hypothetical protein
LEERIMEWKYPADISIIFAKSGINVGSNLGIVSFIPNSPNCMD